MERQGFEGKVTFEVTGPTLREVVIRHGFIRAVPECMTFTGDASALFSNIIAIVSRTKAVTTAYAEDDPDIEALMNFWAFAKGNVDYRAVWDAFLDLPSLNVHDQWMNAITGDYLKAPDEVQPGGPTDEELEEMGEKGADFLAEEGHTLPK